MGATGWLIRNAMRRRWWATLPLLLIVLLGATGAFVALGAAQRTGEAYPRYLDRANVGDVAINPSLLTTEIDQVIRTLPGVRQVTTNSLLYAGIDKGAPRPVRELDQGELYEISGSADGGYLEMDRPAIIDGRLPNGRNEAFVDEELASARHLSVGDVVPVSFWSIADDPAGDPNVDPATIVSPIGVKRVEIVGVGTMRDEVLPDGLYPRQRMIVSPDLAARFECVTPAPPSDATFEEAAAILLRRDCSQSYRYYSLDIAGGNRGIGKALDVFVRNARQLNRQLPHALLDMDVRHILIATTTAQIRDRVDRSTRPTVAALSVLGIAAAIVAAIVAALAVARGLRRAEGDQLQWWRLGLTATERAAVVAVPLLIAVIIGLTGSLVLAWAFSTVGPVGTVRSVDPSPARELSSWVWLGALVLGAALVAGVVALTLLWTRRMRPERVRTRNRAGVQRFIPSASGPEITEGVRAAYGGTRGSGVVVASAVVATVVFLAAVVFGASLSSLISSPRSYGWPWDVGSMGGYGYGGLDLEKAERDLARHDEVASWTGLAFTNSVTLDGEPVLSVIGLGGASTVDFAVVEGRLPAGERQVALGSRTADERGIGVGDVVKLAGDDFEPRRAEVTGLVVLPALGPFQSDRAGPGTGMLLPAAAFDARVVDGLVSFFGVELEDGVTPERALADLRDDFKSWDVNNYAPFTHAAPVRPAEIVDAESMRGVPLLVGGLLVVSTVIGLSIAMVMSVRARRRELGVLRALGFTGAQVRRSVRAQALASVVPALLVGVPLGIVTGRFVWQAFASELGVAPTASVPVVWVLTTVVGALAVALVAAAVPARVAARIAPAAALRTE